MRTYLFRCPLQDRARVFPVKGARDALRNLEAGVRAVRGATPFGIARDPHRLVSLAAHQSWVGGGHSRLHGGDARACKWIIVHNMNGR